MRPMAKSEKLRWGILGTGMIARLFGRDLGLSKTGIVTAVASRNLESAAAICRQIGGSPVASYEALLSDPEVDAVYIALPNTLHFEWTTAALRAGKHVLCEKPMALSAPEAEAMFQTADECGRILIEAFMYRAHPQTELLFKKIRSGAIGEPRLIRTNFTFCREASPYDARYQPGAGGGSLMDVGCYCIDFTRSVTGEEPDRAHVETHRHEFGVDDYAAGTLAFPTGTLATFTCGMTVISDQTAHIAGTEGRIEIPRFWKGEEGFTLFTPKGKQTHYRSRDKRAKLPLYTIEADAFAAVVNGDANWNPPENTVANMRVLDALHSKGTAGG